MCVFVINFILLPSLFYQLFVGLQSIYVCLSNSSTSVCPTRVISSPSLPPTSKTPFLVLIFCWLEECDKVLILLCCLAFVTEHFTGHLWKQSFGLFELLVWSIKAVSVISSIWLCLVRAVNKCDLRSATSQTEGSASAFHQPLLAVILVEQMKRRQILQVLSLPWSSIKRLYWKLSLCLHVVGFLFSEALLTYCLTVPASRARACEQTSLGRDSQALLWIFCPISLFPHENCREWIASLSFLCISRTEMINKDQTPQVVVLTEKNKLVNIFVLFFSIFSSEFSCKV